jgi:peptidoglycan hydrolase CwlO-like protein
MAALAKFGAVTSRSVKAEDLTSDITDSGARLTNLRRTEADIRTIMDRSGSVSDIMDAENKLSDVREQIETIESELKSMNGRVAYSSIEIHLAAEKQNKPTDPSVANQLGNAFGSASHALVQSAVRIIAKLIWLVVFFAPYALLLAGAVWLVRLRLRKNAVGG